MTVKDTTIERIADLIQNDGSQKTTELSAKCGYKIIAKLKFCTE